MKFFIGFIFLTSALASHFDFICEKALRYENGNAKSDKIEFFEGTQNTYALGKRHEVGNFIDITNKSFDLLQTVQTDFLPLDLKEDGERIYILFANEIQVRDAYNFNLLKRFQTTIKDISNKSETASELSIFDNRIYVAHGTKHLLILDKITGKILEQKKFDVQKKPSHRSRLTGIEIYKGKVYMMFDNVTYDFGDRTRAFEGMVVADKNTLKTEKIIWLNQKREALHEPGLERDGDVLYSQNLHLLFNYEINKIDRLRSLNPSRRLYNFNNRFLISTPLVKNKTVTGCFRDSYSRGDEPKAIFSSFSY